MGGDIKSSYALISVSPEAINLFRHLMALYHIKLPLSCVNNT